MFLLSRGRKVTVKPFSRSLLGENVWEVLGGKVRLVITGHGKYPSSDGDFRANSVRTVYDN